MNFKRKQICGVMALVLAAYATSSIAGFEIVEDQMAPTAVITSGETPLFGENIAVIGVSRIVHVGKILTTTDVVSGGSADIASAIKLLTPKGWTGVQRGKPDLTKIVRWTSGKSWADAMGDALSQTNLMVELDWTKKKVSVFDLPEKVKVAGNSTTVTVISDKSTKVIVKTTPAPVKAVAPMKAVAPQMWEVKSGETLKTALSRWMAVSGWQLVWEVQNDFELQAGATFTGNIDDALRKVADSAGVNISMYKGNRVCVVREGAN